MKQEANKIPVDDRGWINYMGRVLVVKKGPGSVGNFQFNGTACMQGSVKGTVIADFGLPYELDFDDMTYGMFWYEALVPLKLKGKKYLLTWENCD